MTFFTKNHTKNEKNDIARLAKKGPNFPPNHLEVVKEGSFRSVIKGRTHYPPTICGKMAQKTTVVISS